MDPIDPKHPGERTPPYLYKYRSLASLNNKRFARSLLVDQEFYFPGPPELNDPFESRPYLNPDISDEVREQYTKQAVNRWYGELSRAARRSKIKETRKQSKAVFWNKLHTSFRETFDSVGIFSATSNPIDLLMWPHYADNHRGICVRIDFLRLLNLGHVPFPVTYSSFRPESELIPSHEGDWLQKTILTKGRSWAYEREWRLIENRRASQTIRFDVPVVSGVILGANISREDATEVRQWAQQISRPLEILQAKFHQRDYALELERFG